MASSSPSLGVGAHVKAELRLMLRAFFKPIPWTMLLCGLAYALIIAFSEPQSGNSKLVLVPMAFAYGAFVGLWPGLVVGCLSLSWALVGAWTLVPLVLVPSAIALAFSLAADWIAALTLQVEAAVLLTAHEHEWVVMAAGRLAHAGPAVVVVLVPLLLVDLGMIAFDPAVLGALVSLLLALLVVLLAAVVPALGLSMVVLPWAYLARLRARIVERRKAAAEQQVPESMVLRE